MFIKHCDNVPSPLSGNITHTFADSFVPGENEIKFI